MDNDPKEDRPADGETDSPSERDIIRAYADDPFEGDIIRPELDDPFA